MEQTGTRKTYLDGLRILACVGVIFNHVVGPGVIEGASLPSYLTLFDYFICKLAVPLFFMISGTLLLSRVDSYRKALYRFVRIALALALAIALNYAAHCLRIGEPFDIGTLVLSVYRDRLGITYSYWYLYRYLSLLVMLPILQRMTTRMTTRDMRYFLLLAVGVCGLAMAVLRFAPHLYTDRWLTVPLFSTYIGMLMMGYYIDRHVEHKRGYTVAAAAAVVLGVGIAAFAMYRLQRIDYEHAWYLDRCDRTSVMLAAGGAFYLAKRIDARVTLSPRMQSAVSRIGRLTFPVYLVSELLIENLACVRAWLTARIPVFCAERLYVLAVFAAGLAVAAILRRIPLLRKLL